MEEYKLIEKIYSSKDLEDIESKKQQLSDFLEEVISRRRGENPKEELQAVMLITSTNWAAKVNEKDGSALHSFANMNLLNFLNNHPKYSSEDDCEDFIDKIEKQKTVLQDVHIIISAGKEECLVLINSLNPKLNSFQIAWMKEIIEQCKKHHPSCNMVVGFSNLGNYIEEEPLDNKQEERLLNILNQYEEKLDNNSIKHI